MGLGGIALINMRSSAGCGVVDFVGISLPRCLGSAPRLLGRVQPLLRLGSSERSGRTFGAGSLGTLSAVWESGVYACFQLIFTHKMHKCIVMFVCVMGHLVLNVARCSFTQT